MDWMKGNPKPAPGKAMSAHFNTGRQTISTSFEIHLSGNADLNTALREAQESFSNYLKSQKSK